MLIDPVGDASAAPDVHAIFEQVAQEYGFVPNILRTMAHCPDLLTSFVPLWAQIYSSPTIGARLRALSALGTAKAQECNYCVAHMTASAQRAGLDDREILAIGNAVAEPDMFDQREALVLELAEALTQDPDGTTDDLRARLKETFTDSEIVNIVLAIGMYNLTSRFLKALSINVEEIFDSASEPNPTS